MKLMKGIEDMRKRMRCRLKYVGYGSLRKENKIRKRIELRRRILGKEKKIVEDREEIGIVKFNRMGNGGMKDEERKREIIVKNGWRERKSK